MSINEAIKKRYIRLSKGQRKVAQFVMNNPTVVIVNGAAEVGRQASVSESTVIRFCYAMDLSGYVELQEEIRSSLTSQSTSAASQATYTTGRQRTSHFSKIMQRDIQNIQSTIPLINEHMLQKSAKWMHEADTIYVFGAHQDAAIAKWLSSTLNTLRTNVRQLYTDCDDLVQQLNSMSECATLIVVSSGDYVKGVQTIGEIAKMKKVKIIAITSSTSSPIGDCASALFALGLKNQSTLDIVPVLFSFMHALIEEMIGQDKEHYKQYQQSYEQNLLFLNIAREKQLF